MVFVLTTEKLRKLNKHSFERFCRALLDAEKKARFQRGTVELAGPHLEDVSDGGRDMEALVRAPAIASADTSLLRDKPGWVIYSCKSHKEDPSTRQPQSWVKQVRRDIDPSPSIYDRRRKAVFEDASERATRTPDALRELIERLCQDDAEYRVLVNVGASDRLQLAREFARQLRERARRLFGPDVDVRDDQVRVLDANELVNAFNERPFVIPDDLERQLGGRDDVLRAWSEWTQSIANERRFLDYVEDHHRVDLHARLESLMDQSTPGSLWVVGDPGVGKTRAVHRFFETHPEIQRRVRQTDDWEDVDRWLRQDHPQSMRDVLLVVDEVPSVRGDDLAREFRRSATTTEAKLVMIGTRGEGQGNTSLVFALPRLEHAEFRQIIETELDSARSQGAARARVSTLVERLSQGYPLFAMWLTRGLANNPELLDEPGTGLTDEQDPWKATSLVLASLSAHSTREQWEAMADIRGRALLLAMLAPSERWSFSSELEQGFASALGRAWADLSEAARACRQRGILRETRRGDLYISPANLERLVLNHYFGGPHPPIEPHRLRDRLGSRVDRLLVRAQWVGASASCRRGLAGALLDPMIEDLERGNVTPGALLRIARELPMDVARRTHRLLEATGGQDTRLAEELSHSFRHLRHRKIDEETFALVEDAMFTLGPDSEWASLFASGFHATYQAFEFRIGLLQMRMESTIPGDRLAAITGLSAAIEPRSGLDIRGFDDVDAPIAGPWETPNIDESAQRAARGWELLLRAANDHDQGVSDAARQEIVDGLRLGLAFGLRARPSLLRELVEVAPRWTLLQRNALGSAIDDVDRYDTEELRDAPETLITALDALRTAVHPDSLEERLIAQIGRWHPLSGPINAPDIHDKQQQADRSLARECLAQPERLLGCQQWLDSHHAVRAFEFGRALGEVDQRLVLLDPLRDRVEAGSLRSLTASYLAAWARRDPPAFDAWIEEHASRPALGEVIAIAIAGNDASSLRAEVLSRLVEQRSVNAVSLRGIGSWGWAERLDTDVLDRLITALVDTHDEDIAKPAVGLAYHRVKARSPDPTIADVLVRLVDQTRSMHLPAAGDRDWAALVVALMLGGRTDVLESIARAIGDVGYSHQVERAINELLAEGFADDLWRVFSRRLAEDPIFALRMKRLIAQTSFRERLPAETIMEWVGHDRQRATTAAELTAPHAEVLDPLARALLERFGHDSDPAEVIASRAGSTPNAVNSLAHFWEQQADHATAWARDNDGEVSRWASRLAADLRVRAAAERDEDQLMRRLG